MEKITKRAKKIRLVFIASTAIMCMLMMISFPWMGRIIKYDFKHNYYTIYIDGVKAGSSDDYQQVKNCIKEARKRINDNSSELRYMETDIQIKKDKRITGICMDSERMTEKIYELLNTYVDSSNNAYVIDIDGYILTMKSLADVEYLFTAVRKKYDNSNKFNINLHTAQVSGHTTIACDVLKADIQAVDIPTVGSGTDSEKVIDKADIQEGNSKDVINVTFEEKVDIVPCYVNESQIEELNTAIDKVTADKNNSELSVLVNERQTYDVEYDVEVQYEYNDNLYNNEQNVIQEGSKGIKRIYADVTYRNGEELTRNIVDEYVLQEAVPQIIEIGTAVPPVYVKPIHGGTLSSVFGERWGTRHKGVDWACNVGTEVMASCDGEVIQAGWVNGYGYCVTLEHSDGKCTRYGHLSQILSDAGQSVSQGEIIALSGNTGNSTGPHVHFEVIVNGVQENPFKYIE